MAMFLSYTADSQAHATLGSKSITDNGTYDPSDDNLDGYSEVTVAVPLGTKTINTNGTYNASSDSLKGYSQVVVNTPTYVSGTKNIVANGTYNASSDNYDGYSSVSVAVPSSTLGTKSITTNGTYAASSDNLDGYSSVTVNVSSSSSIIDCGVYTANSDNYQIDITSYYSDYTSLAKKNFIVTPNEIVTITFGSSTSLSQYCYVYQYNDYLGIVHVKCYAKASGESINRYYPFKLYLIP